MRRNLILGIVMIFCVCLTGIAAGQGGATQGKEERKTKMTAATFDGLKLRNIGPANKSGRVSDIVKDPTDKSVWYVAVSSGNVWKTVNNGTTWTPIFDNYGSYSMGCITIDPANPKVLWLGSGENKSQRSVGYGDGVYKSLDGGKTWANMGLVDSLTISKILIDPRDSDTVYVASKGPLWAPGGDRGLFKTTDGGKSWKPILEISENTGISDIAFDPGNPDIIYAASYQRRRHVGILVAGGPESGIYKSSDAGATWKKLTSGLPGGSVGRIGIAVSPIKHNVVYALIAASDDKSGFYRSEDRGESWTKMSDYICVDPQYYMEIYPDPHLFDCVYSMDVWMHVTEDGGATFKRVNSRHKHVDNHALVFDPDDPDYLMIGCDGGIYETWDRCKTWRFVDNLPIMQFYRVGIDNVSPFYNVYGGTQDNGSMGGPSRTAAVHGICNSDWFTTVGGDGYQVRVDPENQNIVYTMSQYGGLVRFDRATGERIDIKPQPDPGEQPLKWYWDSPLIISPHAPARIYFGANKLFRSDDRGDTWRAVSPDLTAGIDRNKREVMGRVWSVDAVWKNVFTSYLGNMTALSESPLVEGLIYCGMDDGLIQVTEDGGESWRKISEFPGVPKSTYVTDVFASQHNAGTVYATFENHNEGDYKPYALKSTDMGRSWTPIAGGLPERHIVWSIVEDHVNPNLLFLGTELGLFFSVDGGDNWVQLKGNVPVIPFRDLEIQKRENDLVCAAFGRGFYILDDYTPLREISAARLEEEAVLFPVCRTWMYIPSQPFGWGEKAGLGDGFFTAPNPPYGAVFTYYLRDSLKTARDERRELEEARMMEGKPNNYPSWEELRGEEREAKPVVVLTVSDSEGNVVRRITGPTGAGFHRVAWDLRYILPRPTEFAEPENPWGPSPSGPLALPGLYTVSLAKLVDGKLIPMGEPQLFETIPLAWASLPSPNYGEQLQFQQKASRLLRAALGAAAVVEDVKERLRYINKSLLDTAAAGPELPARAREIELKLADIDLRLNGDRIAAKYQEPTLPSILDRIDRITEGFWSTAKTTTTHLRQYEIAAEEFAEVYESLKALLEVDLKALEQEMDRAGAPWTPGRPIPEWSKE
jgi:photosystem II stability/assembly factor-like uncharacterized protein